MSYSPDVTQLLTCWNEGDEEALDRLLPLVYDQLREVAHKRLLGERAGHTLNTTALVHEAYIRLVDLDRMQWRDRIHFLAMASRLMRRVLVDYARERRALKRGGGGPRVELDEILLESQAETILDLDDSLTRLKDQYPRIAEAVEHRYFGGLTNEEIAEVLGVSLATVERDFKLARAWISREWGGE